MKNRFQILLATLSAFLPFTANAHVKWFTRVADPAALTLSELNRPAFWFLLALSVVTIAGIVFADRALEIWQPFSKFNKFLETKANEATLILRVFTGAALLLSWQMDSMIAPELKITSTGGWYQFALVLLLLTRTTTPVAGLGMIGLYGYAITQYGFFHLLDYLIYPAIGYYFVAASVKDRRISQTRIPALYIGLGFSLCWAALEKVFFPTWGIDVLVQQPMLTMGLPNEFFLLACAFVELSLGYLLIIGVLQRPLAIVITIVFVTTSAFFGKTEVIGHTILHGALFAVAALGPGHYYPAPIQFHDRLPLRAAFAAVNFVLLVGILGVAYYWMASGRG